MSTTNTTTSTDAATITRELVPENERMEITAKLFGVNFPLRFEPFVYGITERIAKEYRGGYWKFFQTGTGAFFMTPDSDTLFNVSCENGFGGQLSADALGITVCLYAYSNLSFGGDAFAETCAEQYHLMREYMFEHHEVASILSAID